VIALLVFAGLFGAIVGSFLNVVIHRLPRDEPLGLFKKSRSVCPSCGAMIRWFDNLPLLSYIVLLRGRCRACGGRISLRYPLVEAACAALFIVCAARVAALGWTPPVLAFLVAAAFSALLLAAAVIDWEHKLLLDKLTLRAGPVIALAGVLAIDAVPGTTLLGYELAGGSIKPGLASLVVGVAGALVGGGVILLIRWLGTMALRREAMGLGDAKFMATCGLLLGPGPVLLALGVALVGGSLLGLIIWAVTRNREIPFGPFLAAGAWTVLMYGDAIHRFVFVTYPAWAAG
jgi:leader peptidase (prepilin peptidase)/N-methyltransferase